MNTRDLSPQGRGRIASTDAIRVRGLSASPSVWRNPHPKPSRSLSSGGASRRPVGYGFDLSPRRAGRGEEMQASRLANLSPLFWGERSARIVRWETGEGRGTELAWFNVSRVGSFGRAPAPIINGCF